jgi:hypothetical protein
MFIPRTLPPKSSMAILAALMFPQPAKSAYGPDISVSVAILSVSAEKAGDTINPEMRTTTMSRINLLLLPIVITSFLAKIGLKWIPELI